MNLKKFYKITFTNICVIILLCCLYFTAANLPFQKCIANETLKREKGMKIVTYISSIGPHIDSRIASYVILKATYPLNEREVALFGRALQLVADQLEKDKIEKLLKVNIIFTEKGKVEIEMDNQKTLGTQVRCCIYAIRRIRDRGYDDARTLLVFLEELVHHFWQEEDEYKTACKVIEIMKCIYPSLKFEDLYKPAEYPAFFNAPH